MFGMCFGTAFGMVVIIADMFLVANSENGMIRGVRSLDGHSCVPAHEHTVGYLGLDALQVTQLQHI